MCWNLSIMRFAGRLAVADIIYLLRFQRTAWVFLHCTLLLGK
jgi:hypothetical protein